MRERRIIKELYNTKQYLNLNYFSNLYNVSTRTILSDFSYLSKVAKENGFEIGLKRNEGYYLVVLDDVSVKKFMDDTDEVVIENRAVVMAAILLLSPDYHTQEEFADILQVSKSLIKIEMNQLNDLCVSNGMQLERKAHYGLKIDCEGTKRIELLVKIFIEHPEIYDFVSDSNNKSKFKKIEKGLVDCFKKYNLSANYAEMIKCDMFLKVIVLLLENEIISDSKQGSDNSIYGDMAGKLVETINLECGVNAICYFNEIARWMKEKTKSITDNLYDGEINFKVNEFLKIIDEKNRTEFECDTNFKKVLLAHVVLLVERSSQQIYFDNPLVHEISVKYPAVFNIAIQFVRMLEQEYNIKITQDEIGFIATHFAAKMEKDFQNKPTRFSKVAILCSSGGGSAFIIKLKIEMIFPKSEIQTFSFFELDDVKIFEPDIIFTIKDLDEKFNVPVVHIKELIDDMDVKRIKTILTETNFDKFTELFNKDNFAIYEKYSYSNLLEIMATQLEVSGYAKKGYKDYIMQRENVISTIYQNGLAIPHPIEMVANKNSIGIGLVKGDLIENDKKVKVIFMVNLGKGNLEIHQQISQIFFELMQNEKNIHLIQSSKTFDEFIKNMSLMIEKR